MKYCPKCEIEKQHSEFYSNKARYDGLHSWCKSCSKSNNRYHHLLRKYDLTEQQYFEILEQQNELCKICGQIETHLSNVGEVVLLSVDHDHITGKVRGLLCDSCNNGLGRFKDNIEYLQSAISYLQEFE